MRSPKSVRRPHIRQQLTNRRKNLGRVAKSQQNQFRQWLLTAVLPNSINDKRKEVFASLELTEQPQKVEKAKKSDKKKAQKQIAKDHEAEKQVAAKKAAEKEAKRAQADAKKRAAEEEEHKKWKAQQEKVQKEQEKKEAELKKLQNEKKKEKAQKAKESKAAPAPAPAPVAPVEEEVIVKKVAKVDQAAPTKTVEQAQDAAAPAGKKNKNKKKSESESASAPVEQVAEKKEVANEEPKQQVAPQEKKKNKKDKKKSESETAAPVEQVEQIVENSAPAANEIEKKNKKDKKKSESEPAPAEVTPVVSQKPTADNMDFLDFVTAKPDQPEAVVEKVAAAEAAPLEAAPTASDKKKNKKDKKKSESEPATVEASPVVSQKPTADSMDFLDFVTAKPDKPEDVVEQVATSEAAPLEAAPAASDHKKKNKKDKKKSENEPAPVEATPVVSQKPTADSMDFLDFVTAKPDQPDDVVEQVATAEASQIETSPVAIEGKKKNKKDKNKSESEKVSEPAPVPEAAASVSQKPTADSMDFLDFVTAKPDAVEEQSQNEPATVQEEASVPEQAEKKKNEKKSKKASESEPRPTADDSMDFLDFVSKKPEQEETVQEVKQVEQPKEKTAKKNKKNKKNSESEKNVSTVVEAAHSLPKPDSQTEVADQVDPLAIKVDAPVAEVPAATPIASTKQDADDLDFLNFVTPKAEKETAADTQSAISDTVEKSVPANDAPVDVSPVETALVENCQTATLNKKKNKKDKKKSESDKNSEPSQVVEEPIAAPINQSPLSSKKPTADDMDFLDFVSPKADADYSSVPDVTAPETQLSAPKSSDSFEDLEIVDYDQIAEATSAQAQSPTKSASSPAQRSTPSPTSVLLNRSSKNKKKHHKKHKKHSESDKSQDPSKEDLEFLEFLNSEPKEKSEETPVEAAKPEEKSVEEHIEAPKTVEPIQAENEVDSDVALDSFEIVDAQEVAELVSAPEVTVEETVASAGKKNKKNKNRKNSEKEAKEPTPAPEVVEEVFEKKIVSPNTTENGPAPAAAPVAAPAQKENKNKKKNKKESGNSESHDVAPTVEIPQTTDAGKQSPGSDKENSSVPNGSAKKQLSVEELDYGVTAQNNEAAAGGDKKNKKKNKKGKNSNSISENTQVIAQLDQDHLDQLADDEVQAITGAAGTHSPPIQVHEVTSSEQHANGNGTTIEKQTTIEITQALDDTNISPTQFQKNVQKLVQAQLAKHDIVEIDPTVKLRIDAQLIKLSEKKAPAVVVEHVNYIKPLPMELHVSRPSTPSRDRVYKLLPKDILFCAGLIDSHGENYAAMAADARNLFKDTSRALQRKIRIFKESPHYQTYLRAKEENRPLEEVIAAEAH